MERTGASGVGRKPNVPRRGESYWRALVDRQAASGQGVAEFCAQASVTECTFRRWRQRLRGAGQAQSSGQAGFVDLGVLPAPAGGGRLELSIELGGGVVLRLLRG